jgi:hypothetical protein
MHSIRFAICLAALLSPVAGAQQPQTPPPAKAPAPEATSFMKAASITQTGDKLQIAANSPRPLAQVLDALRQKYGWEVEYEDARYTAKLDFAERPGPDGSPMAFPAGGSFTVEVPAGTDTTPPAEDKTVQLIVDAYNQSKNPGRFGLRQSEGGRYSVAGVGAQDDRGKILVQEPVLDTAISLPEENRTASATLDLICQKITEQTHVPVTVGVTPRALVDHNDVKVGGKKIEARTLLARTIDGVGHPMYWRLLFDPKSKGYYLDVHGVRGK